MLYSDKRFDVSDQILRTISRANNRKKNLTQEKDKREIENQSLIDDESTLISDLENKDNENINEENNDEPKKKIDCQRIT